MEIISVKITSVFETGAVKAKANAVLGRFGVRGIKVCEGKSGLFVAMLLLNTQNVILSLVGRA